MSPKGDCFFEKEEESMSIKIAFGRKSELW